MISDSGFDLWEALRPLFARACARTLDAAVLFGINKPTSWTSNSVLMDAITAASWVFEDTTDGAKSLMQAAQMVGEDGYGPTGAVLRHGYEFRLGSQKSESLVANPAGANSPFPLMLGGMPLRTNPVYWWDPDIHAIVGDWSKVLVGMRQDIKVEFFNTGVITDTNGAIQINLLQQDMTAARVTMRVGYLLGKTVTNTVDTPSSASSPFAVVTAASGYGGYS